MALVIGLWEYLRGKKTVLTAFLVAVVAFARYADLIDEATFQVIAAIGAAFGLTFLRLGVKDEVETFAKTKKAK